MDLQPFKDKASKLSDDILKLTKACIGHLKVENPNLDLSVIHKLEAHRNQLVGRIKVMPPDRDGYDFVMMTRETLECLKDTKNFLRDLSNSQFQNSKIPSIKIEFKRILYFLSKLVQDFESFISWMDRSGCSLYFAVYEFQYVQSRPTAVDLFGGLNEGQVGNLQELIKESYIFTELTSVEYDSKDFIESVRGLQLYSSNFSGGYDDIEVLLSFSGKVLELTLIIEKESLYLLEMIDKPAGERTIDNILINVNKRFESFKENIATLENTARGELESYKQQFDKLVERVEQSKVSELEVQKTYASRCLEETNAANHYRIAAIITLVVAIVLAICQLQSGDVFTSNIFEMVYRLGLTFLLIALAGYLARESSRHRSLSNTFDRLDLDMAAFRPFISVLGQVEQQKLVKKMAQKVFITNSDERLPSLNNESKTEKDMERDKE